MTTPTVRGTLTGAGWHRMRGLPALAVLACAAPAAAQDTAQAPPPTVPVHAPVETNLQAAYDTSFFSGLRWRNIGPERGGRSIAAAGSTARPMEYWFGATGGGVWKTTDGGTTWRPMSDRHFASSSVGAIGVCEANPDVVYVGMGEVQLRGNIMQGDGVYRTADGGKTWTHVGLRYPGGWMHVAPVSIGRPLSPQKKFSWPPAASAPRSEQSAAPAAQVATFLCRFASQAHGVCGRGGRLPSPTRTRSSPS